MPISTPIDLRDKDARGERITKITLPPLGVAMGVASGVLSYPGAVVGQTKVILQGIGLCALALAALNGAQD